MPDCARPGRCDPGRARPSTLSELAPRRPLRPSVSHSPRSCPARGGPRGPSAFVLRTPPCGARGAGLLPAAGRLSPGVPLSVPLRRFSARRCWTEPGRGRAGRGRTGLLGTAGSAGGAWGLGVLGKGRVRALHPAPGTPGEGRPHRGPLRCPPWGWGRRGGGRSADEPEVQEKDRGAGALGLRSQSHLCWLQTQRLRSPNLLVCCHKPQLKFENQACIA